MKYEDAVKKLSVYGQEHVLRFYETLDEGEKEALLRQIDEIDFSVISALGNEKENIKRGVKRLAHTLEVSRRVNR